MVTVQFSGIVEITHSDQDDRKQQDRQVGPPAEKPGPRLLEMIAQGHDQWRPSFVPKYMPKPVPIIPRTNASMTEIGAPMIQPAQPPMVAPARLRMVASFIALRF